MKASFFVTLTTDEGDFPEEKELDEVLAEHIASFPKDPGHIISAILLEEWETEEEGDPEAGWHSVPCRQSYPFLCPECNGVVRALAITKNLQGPEDRPLPNENDAYWSAEGNGLLCGGDRCDNPPTNVIWENENGEVKEKGFDSEEDAYEWVGRQLRENYEDEVEGMIAEWYKMNPEEIDNITIGYGYFEGRSFAGDFAFEVKHFQPEAGNVT